MADQFGFTQHVRVPTRSVSNNLLDLMYTSKPNLISSVEVVTGMSDHAAVLSSVDLRPKMYHKPPHKIYQYSKAKFDEMRSEAASYFNYFFSHSPEKRSVDEN